jgi:monothiol glutaredoxin
MTGSTRAATSVQQIAAAQLKALLDSAATLELVDVRTDWEREAACISGSRLLDNTYGDYILGLDRSTTLVFFCHHGIRSQGAAEYCVGQGFTNVYNLAGGIDAWSLIVDPAVPRY